MLKEKFSTSAFEVGESYSRPQMATLGGVAGPTGPRDPHWATGIIRFDNAVLLLVTLEKDEYSYLDYFDGSLFWWQSQNQQTQNSPVIAQLAAGELRALLFVRIRSKSRGATNPFVYCGPLSRPDLEGEKPVTALFGLLDFRVDATGALADVYRWRPEGSLPAESERLRHKEIVARQSRGQGRQLDPKLRRAVELFAMRAAIEHYEAAGWIVEDTSKNRPYDLLCLKGADRRRVEVKGTQSSGDEVLLTIGEVNAARDQAIVTDLFILHSIAAKKNGDTYHLTGGRIKLVGNWSPEEHRLSATAFFYSVPENAIPYPAFPGGTKAMLDPEN